MSEGAVVAGARCATHPEVTAGATCARCGDFLCRPCVKVKTGTQTYCPNCATHFGAVREAHLRHEASVRSIGLLYYVIAAALLIGWSLYGAARIAYTANPNPSAVALVSAFVLPFVALSLYVGRGLRQLRSWSRSAGAAMAIPGLLGFPAGTLIHGYVLWLLLGEKGRFVFSPTYQAVIAATPELSCRTSRVVLGAIALLVLFVLGGVLMSLLGY